MQQKEKQWTYIIFFLTGSVYFLFGFISGAFFESILPFSAIMQMWSTPLLIFLVLFAVGLYAFKKRFLNFLQKANSYAASFLIFLVGFIGAMFLVDVFLSGIGFSSIFLLLLILTFSAIGLRAFKKHPEKAMINLEAKNINKAENISDLKIFLLCISSGAIGFTLISILPHEIPFFLRVSIAFLFLGIPLLDFKKIVLFGIAGGLGFFIKDFIIWDLFAFKWTSAYGNSIEFSLLTGLMIGTLLSGALWNRKAIGIFPLTVAIAFSIAPLFPLIPIVFSVGMCIYLLSIKKTPSPLRKILLTFGILFVSVFVFFMIIGSMFTFGHPPYVGQTVVPVGEVAEKNGIRMAVTNYTFIQNNTGRDMKVGIIVRNPGNVSWDSYRFHLWYRQDEYLGTEIIEQQGYLEKTGSNTTTYYLFKNLPMRLPAKDFAVVWEVWTSKGIEYVIWQTK